jgi:hypothetical protein
VSFSHLKNLLQQGHLETLAEADREEVLLYLQNVLTTRLVAASDFYAEIRIIIQELKQLGYPLYLFDSDGDWELWCGDWTEGAGGVKLILNFDPVEGVEASWSNPTA